MFKVRLKLSAVVWFICLHRWKSRLLYSKQLLRFCWL